MTLTSILTGIFAGIGAGFIIGFLIVTFKRYFQVKNSVEKIKNQKMKYILDGKPYDFVGDIDRQTKLAKAESNLAFHEKRLEKLQK